MLSLNTGVRALSPKRRRRRKRATLLVACKDKIKKIQRHTRQQVAHDAGGKGGYGLRGYLLNASLQAELLPQPILPSLSW